MRILTGAEEARPSRRSAWISGFFRPIGAVGDMGGGSLEVAEALDDHAGASWVSLPLGALPVEAMLAEGPGEAKRADRRESFSEKLAPERRKAGGSTPSAADGARSPRRISKRSNAPVQGRLTATRCSANEARAFAKSLLRLSPATLAFDALRRGSRRARTLPAAALLLDRVIKRLAPSASSFPRSACARACSIRNSSAAEQYLDPLVEGAQLIGLPLARVPDFAVGARACWTAELFSGETPGGDAAAPRRLRALRHRLARRAGSARGGRRFRRVLQFPFIGVDHAERAFLAAAIHCALLPASPTRPGSSPRLVCFTPPRGGWRANSGARDPARLSFFRRRACGCSRARSCGSSPTSSASKSPPAARAPDSEVVGERLKLLANALGVRRSEIVVVEAEAKP